ncbi:MAG: hypothetical protein HOI95_19620, partial [Chromatiales bacterium]|nr:hypothetical protein [Chromatiales bacterium]
WHDLDEGNLHTRAHAAIQIVPAILAEAEVRAATGKELIDALIFAYEVAGRLWRATQARFAVHPHGTYGPLAAAVSLARLRGESPEQIYAAMNIGMTLGIAASRQTLGDGATIRNTYSGHSGRAGYDALAFRDVGLTGERDAPSSILGDLYGEAFAPDIAAADLNDVWWMRKSYFKRFASGRYVHGVLDALEILLSRLGGTLNAKEVRRIDVATFFMAATMGQQRVDTPFGMRFSIPALLATRILRGPTPLVDDGAQAFSDTRVHQLAEKVFVSEDKAATATYPDNQPTCITVTFTDGHREVVSVDKMLGESDYPLSAAQLSEKFIELAAPTLGSKGAQSCYVQLSDVDTCDNVANLLENITAMVPAA